MTFKNHYLHFQFFHVLASETDANIKVIVEHIFETSIKCCFSSELSEILYVLYTT